MTAELAVATQTVAAQTVASTLAATVTAVIVVELPEERAVALTAFSKTAA